MSTKEKSPMGLKRKGGVLLTIAFSSVLFSHIAEANTSAGTILRNTVTLDYADVNNVAQPQETDTVDVTVDMVPSVAWGVAPSNQTVQSAQALPSAYTITLTNTGNGSDAYDITDNTTETCTTGTLGTESFGFTTPVTLGATVSAAAGVFALGQTTISVSNMTTADFGVGNTVMIGTLPAPFVVVSATAGVGIAPDTLVVTGDATGAGGATGAGVQIGERISYSYGATGNAGALSGAPTPGVGCQHDHELVADGTLATGGNTDSTDTVNGWSTIVENAQLSVAKYVRNVTDGTKNAGGGVSLYGQTYYPSGVTGNPGQTLEYIVVATNASSGDATDVKFVDTLPTYTTYVASSLVVDADGNGTMDAAIVGETLGIDAIVGPGGVLEMAGNVITVYAGVAGDEDTATGGSVQDVGEALNTPSNTTAIRYRVTIN